MQLMMIEGRNLKTIIEIGTSSGSPLSVYYISILFAYITIICPLQAASIIKLMYVSTNPVAIADLCSVDPTSNL